MIRKVTTAGIITTVAGTGQLGWASDGHAARNTPLNYPAGIAVDAAGNMYFTDLGNNLIRKIDDKGIVSTVAGNGFYGYSGDGGAATSAQLAHPSGVTLDGSGNLYVSDSGNNVVRKVTPAGVISTVAGNGTWGFGGDGGAATNAQLAGPWGVALDSAGNLYIGDSRNARIRKVTPAGVITTLAGNGTTGSGGDGGAAADAWLNTPLDVAVNADGVLYFADSANDRVRMVYSALGRVVPVTVKTNPPNFPVTIDGLVYSARQNFSWVSGLPHTLAADSQLDLGGQKYRFAFWNDGGAAAHTINPPAVPATYTATFVALTPGVAISGQATAGTNPLGGVGISISGAQTAFTSTDANGNYSVRSLAAGGSYTVTPSLSGYVFDPPSRAFSAVAADQSASFAANRATGFQRMCPPQPSSWWAGESNLTDLVYGGSATNSAGTGFAPGKVGQAFSFNGSGALSMGTAPAIAGTGPFTVEFWLKTDGPGFIVSQRDSGGFNGEYMVSVGAGEWDGKATLEPDKLCWREFGGNSWGFDFCSKATVDDGVFHHVAATREADGSGRIYIDGELDSSQSSEPRPLVPLTVYLGGDGRDGNNYLVGILDEVTIYRTALAPQTIRDIYRADAAGKCRPTITAIVNGASYSPGPVAPGEIITIFGTDLGPASLTPYGLTSDGKLGTTIADTRVLFGLRPSPLLYASNSSVSAIVPYALDGGITTSVQVERGGTTLNGNVIPVARSFPGFFMVDANGQAAAFNQDSTQNLPGRPAARGTFQMLSCGPRSWGTGEGQTNPPGSDGLIARDTFPKPQLPVSATLGGQAAEILYAGVAPFSVAGLLQVNLRVPDNCPSGQVPVILKVGESSSPLIASVSIAPSGPISLGQIAITPANAAPGDKLQVTATLAGPAPQGGVWLTLTNTVSGSTPTMMFVDAGRSSAVLEITAPQVSTPTIVTYTAGLLGAAATADVAVSPKRP